MERPTEMPTPNFLLITVDCLRADRLGVMGNPDGLTPGLDKLAQDAVYLADAYTNGAKTVESFPSIFTSTYPFQYADSCKLSEHRTSIAEVLRDAGFHTAGFASNPFLSERQNYSKGFVHFQEFKGEAGALRGRGKRQVFRMFGKKSAVRRLLRQAYRSLSGYQLVPYVRGHVVNSVVLEHMKTIPQPFFTWIHYMDPHQPYAPVPEYMPFSSDVHKRLIIKLGNDPHGITPEELRLAEEVYNAEIRYQDRQITLLLEGMEDLGLLDNLVVIVTADHGEEFREHGDFFHATLYKAKLYRELLHVPLIIWGSTAHLPSGKRIDGLVSLADLAPTVIDWVGLEQPASWVGTSLLPAIWGDAATERERVFAQQALKDPDPSQPRGLALSSRSKDWTFIYNGVTQEHELYDRIDDPGETVNLYHCRPEVAQQLESDIMQYSASSVDPDYAQGIPDFDDFGTDEETLERLRGLGYID